MSEIIEFPGQPLKKTIVERLAEFHVEEIMRMKASLMRGVPPEGGLVSFEMMEQLLETAFLSGALASRFNPLPPETT